MKALLLFLLCTPAYAESLGCHADFDAGAHYDLSAVVNGGAIEGEVLIRYQDEENDKRASLKPGAQNLLRNSAVHFAAGNANMDTRVDASYEPSSAAYEGALHVSFHVDGVPPVDLPVRCTWN